MIEKLPTPFVIENLFGRVTLTHRAYGFTYQLWNSPALQSYSVLGVLCDDGSFKAFPGTETNAPIDVSNLRGEFSVGDVVALHKEIAETVVPAATDRGEVTSNA